jgi:hypothetical protein
MVRDFKGGEKHRDDSFAETPPQEAKRLSISRAMTKRMGAQDKGIIMKETRQKDRGNFTSARKMLKSMGTPDGVGVH